MTDLVCWKCGAPLGQLPMPLSRLETCRACGAEIHCCRACEFYEPRWRRGCREERAEDVSDRERANFCDYIRLRPDACQPRPDTAASRARAELDALFGGGEPAAPADAAPSAEARARAELERLFGKK